MARTNPSDERGSNFSSATCGLYDDLGRVTGGDQGHVKVALRGSPNGFLLLSFGHGSLSIRSTAGGGL
jgi:hypothetical protein